MLEPKLNEIIPVFSIKKQHSYKKNQHSRLRLCRLLIYLQLAGAFYTIPEMIRVLTPGLTTHAPLAGSWV